MPDEDAVIRVNADFGPSEDSLRDFIAEAEKMEAEIPVTAKAGAQPRGQQQADQFFRLLTGQVIRHKGGVSPEGGRQGRATSDPIVELNRHIKILITGIDRTVSQLREVSQHLARQRAEKPTGGSDIFGGVLPGELLGSAIGGAAGVSAGIQAAGGTPTEPTDGVEAGKELAAQFNRQFSDSFDLGSLDEFVSGFENAVGDMTVAVVTFTETEIRTTKGLVVALQGATQAFEDAIDTQAVVRDVAVVPRPVDFSSELLGGIDISNDLLGEIRDILKGGGFGLGDAATPAAPVDPSSDIIDQLRGIQESGKFPGMTIETGQGPSPQPSETEPPERPGVGSSSDFMRDIAREAGHLFEEIGESLRQNVLGEANEFGVAIRFFSGELNALASDAGAAAGDFGDLFTKIAELNIPEQFDPGGEDARAVEKMMSLFRGLAGGLSIASFPEDAPALEQEPTTDFNQAPDLFPAQEELRDAISEAADQIGEIGETLFSNFNEFSTEIRFAGARLEEAADAFDVEKMKSVFDELTNIDIPSELPQDILDDFRAALASAAESLNASLPPSSFTEGGAGGPEIVPKERSEQEPPIDFDELRDVIRSAMESFEDIADELDHQHGPALREFGMDVASAGEAMKSAADALNLEGVKQALDDIADLDVPDEIPKDIFRSLGRAIDAISEASGTVALPPSFAQGADAGIPDSSDEGVDGGARRILEGQSSTISEFASRLAEDLDALDTKIKESIEDLTTINIDIQPEQAPASDIFDAMAEARETLRSSAMGSVEDFKSLSDEVLAIGSSLAAFRVEVEGRQGIPQGFAEDLLALQAEISTLAASIRDSNDIVPSELARLAKALGDTERRFQNVQFSLTNISEPIGLAMQDIKEALFAASDELRAAAAGEEGAAPEILPVDLDAIKDAIGEIMAAAPKAAEGPGDELAAALAPIFDSLQQVVVDLAEAVGTVADQPSEEARALLDAVRTMNEQLSVRTIAESAASDVQAVVPPEADVRAMLGGPPPPTAPPPLAGPAPEFDGGEIAALLQDILGAVGNIDGFLQSEFSGATAEFSAISADIRDAIREMATAAQAPVVNIDTPEIDLGMDDVTTAINDCCDRILERIISLQVTIRASNAELAEKIVTGMEAPSGGPSDDVVSAVRDLQETVAQGQSELSESLSRFADDARSSAASGRSPSAGGFLGALAGGGAGGALGAMAKRFLPFVGIAAAMTFALKELLKSADQLSAGFAEDAQRLARVNPAIALGLAEIEISRFMAGLRASNIIQREYAHQLSETAKQLRNMATVNALVAESRKEIAEERIRLLKEEILRDDITAARGFLNDFLLGVTTLFEATFNETMRDIFISATDDMMKDALKQVSRDFDANPIIGFFSAIGAGVKIFVGEIFKNILDPGGFTQPGGVPVKSTEQIAEDIKARRKASGQEEQDKIEFTLPDPSKFFDPAPKKELDEAAMGRAVEQGVRRAGDGQSSSLEPYIPPELKKLFEEEMALTFA